MIQGAPVLLLLLVAVLCSGCAALTARHGVIMVDYMGSEPRLSAPTPIFSGVVTDMSWAAEELSSPIALVLILIDTPFSLIADLIYLPSDIAFWPTWSEYRSGAKDAAPVTDKTPAAAPAK
jgi:uncharacterized protein YceK